MYKAWNGLAPNYLCSLFVDKTRNSRLRQLHDHRELYVPHCTRRDESRHFRDLIPTEIPHMRRLIFWSDKYVNNLATHKKGKNNIFNL